MSNAKSRFLLWFFCGTTDKQRLKLIALLLRDSAACAEASTQSIQRMVVRRLLFGDLASASSEGSNVTYSPSIQRLRGVRSTLEIEALADKLINTALVNARGDAELAACAAELTMVALLNMLPKKR